MAPVNEAIILAGGLGTRLRDTVPELPKCMAPVAGRPFLFYVINQLRSQGIQRFIFSLGYRSESIVEYLQSEFDTLDYSFCVEKEPLGTGGAIQLALSLATQETVLIANGDTLFKADIQKSADLHFSLHAECSLLLKPMENFDRYGIVETDSKGTITHFREKQFYTSGLINGGIYLLNKSAFLQKGFPEKFSFETDYLQEQFQGGKIYGIKDHHYFIDIGIPSDFKKAQADLQRPPLHLKAVNKDWTVFIDRDGVINHEKKEDYILTWEEFRFYDGVLEALAQLAKVFGRIIIISNQRGVGRRLMSINDLENIHSRMIEKINQAGGRIDHIYYCTATDNKDPNRKPNPGMAFLARNEDQQVRLEKAIMVGNKPSDMKFARNAGVYSVFAATTDPATPFPHGDIDLRVDSLADFASRFED